MAESLPARLRRRVAEQGLGHTVLKLLGDHVFRHSASVVLECRSEWQNAAPARPVPGLDFMVVRQNDALPPLCPWLGPRRADFQQMLTDGKVGLFALRDGQAVGCVWLSLKDHHDPKSREHYPVAPGEAYQFCALTEPSERRRGTTLALGRFGLTAMRQLGVHRLFGVVDRQNRASYQVMRYFGYRECGMLVRHFCIFHTRWTRVSRYAGTLGLRGPGKGKRA
jgi:RimJ/RimL family protein N-acetyltransferase